MNPRVIFKIMGLVLLVSSLTMLPPAAIGLFYGDGDVQPFLEGFLVLFLSGAFLFIRYYHAGTDLKIRAGFLVVAVSWILLGLSGAIPLYFSDALDLSFTDAVFESVSGLTTTGATILTRIEGLPHSVLYFRSQLHWLGGMGIIVLAIAILPMLRIGGMQMFKAETPGPMKDQKLTPRITETAKTLWFIYLGITLLCVLSYWLAGMDLFDAVCHAFATLSTGGYSTHDASLAYFNSPLIETVAVFFMAVSAINFASHFLAWKHATIKAYLQDSEIRTFIALLAVLSVFISLALYLSGTYPSLFAAFRYGIFQTVSFVTTTGFGTAPAYLWPAAIALLLILSSAIGGCAGSTGGGMKVVRVILLYKISLKELYRLIHPHGKFIIKLNGRTVDYRVLDSVSAFFVLFALLFSVFTLLLAAYGEDLVTAASATIASMTNLGPALGKAGASFAELTDASKWTLALAMIFGRLELFTVLVLFTPAYWKS